MAGFLPHRREHPVYRLYDKQKVTHGGNMEFSGGVFKTKEAAKEHAAALNREDS